MISIYCLRDPVTKKIRYIGQTAASLKQRLSGHIADSKRMSSKRCNWIYGLIGKGLRPEIELIRECKDQDDANREESRLIRKLFKQGDLLNGHVIQVNRTHDRFVAAPHGGAVTYGCGVFVAANVSDWAGRLIDRAVKKSRSMSRSDWMRRVLVDAAKRELAK